jgi:hypothetical protein
VQAVVAEGAGKRAGLAGAGTGAAGRGRRAGGARAGAGGDATTTTPILSQERPPPTAELLDTARRFIEQTEWRVAVTMPESPHSYVVRTWPPSDGFTALVTLVQAHGTSRRWQGRSYRSYEIGDGFVYWFVWPVLNRKPVEP